MQTSWLLADRSLPILIHPDTCEDDRASITWAAQKSQHIKDLVSDVGVALIRGLRVSSAEAFRAICEAIEPNLQPYTGGDSPRTGVADKVYTSTEYDASLEVLLHNELSYAGWSPNLIFFGCLQPSLTGGETHIADGRTIYERMPPRIRTQFEEKGIIYLQHLWDAKGEPGIGKSWQETFETEEREEAERYLRTAGMDWEWTDYGLRTRAAKDAVLVHPKTDQKCWWNQADQWHRDIAGVKTSFGASDDARFDPASAGEKSLGNHVVYGDGSEISADDLMTVRQVSASVEVKFPWQQSDVMIIDNILAMHGRKPFTGPRRVVVAMA